MNIGTKILIFCILFNFSIAIIPILIPETGPAMASVGIGNDVSLYNQFNEQTNSSISQNQQSSPLGGFSDFYRNIMTFFSQVSSVFNLNLIYGFINVLQLIPLPNPGTRIFLFGSGLIPGLVQVLWTLFIFITVFGWFTNKNPTGDF
jgi:hypothetical protein